MSKYPTIIEQDTNYSFTIKESANLSFNKIREYSSSFFKMLPTNLQEKLYNDILHGACELDSEPKLNAYMFALGKMHNAKLQRAYDKLSADFCSEQSIDIIDYACGQGLGTICYADFLKRSSSNQKVRRIILIEPSKLALARAALHVTHLFPDAEVITINKGFDDLTSEDLYAERETPTLHIISNVLDMGTTWEHEGFFDLQNFAELITQTVDGKNEFVCVEPLFGYEPKDEKVDLFMNHANIDTYYSLNRSKGEFVSGESWSCVIRVGRIHKNVDDGVEYDGTRLVSADPKKISGEYIIKDGTTEIRDYAFHECKSLTSVTIPKSVTEIGHEAFMGCSGLTNITIPERVTEIGHEAFCGCSGLTSITIPEGVTVIGMWAFCGCTGLTSITIPEGVTKIGFEAFFGCSGLTSITIPESVTEIGDKAFNGCSGLTKVEVSEDNQNYCSKDGVLFSKDMRFLIKCSGGKKGTYTIPEGVTVIEFLAFSGCSGLTSITIPEGVTEIEFRAFSRCSGLTSITIPEGVTVIEEGAFCGCSGLTSITIPESVRSIGSGAFKDTALYKNKDNWNNGVLYIDNCLINAKPDVVPSEYTIRQGTRVIANFAFDDCSGLTSITIPESVTEIGNFAFDGCSGLTSVTIPKSVTVIGDGAFSECSGLKSITIPEGVTEIASYAFSGCSGLTSVTIPESVTEIGNGAFEYCSGLTSITIPESVTKIGYGAFRGCKNLTSITLPKCLLTQIGDKIFYDCSSLTITKTNDDLPFDLF